MPEYFPYIFLISWFVLLMAIGWIKDYKKSLILNMMATLSFFTYAYLINQGVAAAMSLIACANSLIQFALPQSDDLKNKRIRNGIAVICAVVASIILYDKPADILPCLATSVIRIGEAQQSVKWLKAGFMSGMILLMSFGILEQLYFMACLQAVIAGTFLYRLYRSHKEES